MNKPKILYICTAPPYGETYGMGLRSRNIGLLLKSIGNVTMLAISPKPWTEDALERTREVFDLPHVLNPVPKPTGLLEKLKREVDATNINTHSLQLKQEDQRILDQLIAEHDITWIHTIKVANIVGRTNWDHCVLDVDDYPSQFHLTVSSNTKSLKEKFHRSRRARIWKKREALLPQRFQSIVVCKDKDQSAFDAPEQTYVVGNGFEKMPLARESADALSASPRLGLIGNYNYRLNSDAIEWFVKDAWPTVRAKVPHARIRLVGRGAERYHNPDLQIDGLGFVDDPTAELSTWSALIAPTRMGGGTSVKIAEAFARRIPVIASTHGARGYAVENGKGILISDDPSQFSEYCIRLLSDPQFGESLAANAYQFFEKSLAWETMLPAVQAAVKNALPPSS